MLGNALKKVRQNHALEHAMVSLLLDRDVRPPLGGYSTAGGFFIFGRVSTEVITDVAHEALHRLKRGQSELAISPYCGTNLLTGATLARILSALILRGGRRSFIRVSIAAIAIIGAAFASRPLGEALQRRFTTLAEVPEMEITGISRLKSGSFTVHRISTRST